MDGMWRESVCLQAGNPFRSMALCDRSTTHAHVCVSGMRWWWWWTMVIELSRASRRDPGEKEGLLQWAMVAGRGGFSSASVQRPRLICTDDSTLGGMNEWAMDKGAAGMEWRKSMECKSRTETTSVPFLLPACVNCQTKSRPFFLFRGLSSEPRGGRGSSNSIRCWRQSRAAIVSWWDLFSSDENKMYKCLFDSLRPLSEPRDPPKIYSHQKSTIHHHHHQATVLLDPAQGNNQPPQPIWHIPPSGSPLVHRYAAQRCLLFQQPLQS